MANKEVLLYDKTDPISIYEYALPLIDHTLREIVGDAAVAGYNSNNKGEPGQMVEELYYHYKPNSSPEPDFREAGVELKTTGLKELKDMTLQIKGKLVVDMIISTPSSTIRQHEILNTQILYATYSQTNSWNHQFSSSLTNTRANAWNARCHRGNGNIAAQRLVHFSKLRASVLS